MFCLKKRAYLLLIENLFSRILMFMSVPFFSIYLVNVRQFTLAEASYIVGINPFAIVISSLFIGKIIRHYSLNQLLAFVPFIWGTAYIFISFAEKFLFLLLLNGIVGVCYAIYEPSTKHMASKVKTEKEKQLFFQLRYVTINLGGLIGPFLANFLVSKQHLYSYMWLGSCYILIGIINYRAIYRKKRPYYLGTTHVQPVDYKQPSQTAFQAFVCFVIGSSFSYFGYAQFQSTVGQYYMAHHRFHSGIEDYSRMLMASQLLVIILQVALVPLLVKKQWSPYVLLVSSNLLFSVSLVAVVHSERHWVWLLMITTYSLAELLLGSQLDYAVNGLAKMNTVRDYVSLVELVKLGSTVGPIVGSYLIEQVHYSDAFLLLASITSFGSLFLIISSKKKEKRIVKF